ncbi:MAG: hypothetical protein M1281_06870 [Chloroflexi bacterium]|nr:hypothetical protein [Chloroflexota bacterium]
MKKILPRSSALIRRRASRFITSLAIILSTVLIVTLSTDVGSIMTVTGSPSSPQGNSMIILAWNDLGMHCYNNDFQDLAILPPYNTLWAQVIQVGDPPKNVTSGITVEYSFPENTSSAGKTNFWTYAQQLFGVSLQPNIGLTGKGLSGTMDLEGDHYVARGIPLTEFRDDSVDPVQAPYPYQLAQIVVKDAVSGVILAQTTVVAPVSSEMNCVNCHSDTGDATSRYPIAPQGRVAANILAIHDYLSQSQYPAGHTEALLSKRPVLCAECHPDNALGAPGIAGVSSLSNAMHKHHSGLEDITPDTDGCYNCHPGPETQCLRDVMSQEYSMTCVDCHGDIANVAENPEPWLNEPRCDNAKCHGEEVNLTQPLYRFSVGHGRLYCEGCHDSTHAIATSREPNDAIKFVNLQGHTGTLKSCETCHGVQPTASFVHKAVFPKIYLPVIGK